MRLVLDTNTVISGLLWPDGNPSKLIDAAEAGQVELFTSVALLNELQRVIAREKFTKQLSKRQIAVRDLFDGYAAIATVLTPAVIAPTIVRDPADDAVLACALAANAELIVSGDDDLHDIGTYRGIRIVAAREAVEIITGSVSQ